MKARFNYPTRILFGHGAVEDLPDEMAGLGSSRPLVVSDKGLAATDIPKRIVALLEAKGLVPALFTDVSPNPSDAQVDAGAQAFKAHQADGVVAVGGGSPMDAARAIQIRIHHHEPLESYDDLIGGDAKITGDIPPLIAVPTTAGTGSEVSRSAVITIAAVDRKVVLFSPRLMPAVSVCDPELTYGLPPRVTAETGMDALSHSVEAYVSKGYHPMADGIALTAIAMIGTHLPTAVATGTDPTARQEMMMASTMGAVAFQKGLGVAHSLAHPLSSVAGVSHGLANAIVLPHVLRFNGEVVPERVEAIGRALGAEAPGVEGTAKAVAALAAKIGLPTRLAQVGLEDGHIAKIVEKAMEDGCHGCNPRVCEPKDMKALLLAAM